MNSTSPPSRSPTGVQGLDDVLHGGLIAGRLYLLDGNPGAGKTHRAYLWTNSSTAGSQDKLARNRHLVHAI